MTTLAYPDIAAVAANDDHCTAGIVSAHLLRRRMERRLMLGVALLAGLVLTATVITGYQALQPMPDLVTFAARV